MRLPKWKECSKPIGKMQISGGTTPTLQDPNLAWSPNNSTQQLVKLVDTATQTLESKSKISAATTSWRVCACGYPRCERALDRSRVRPWQGLFNYQFFSKLPRVQIHVEPNGNSIEQPYMHSKMMVADGKYIYVGSINYSFNSTKSA